MTGFYQITSKLDSVLILPDKHIATPGFNFHTQ